MGQFEKLVSDGKCTWKKNNKKKKNNELYKYDIQKLQYGCWNTGVNHTWLGQNFWIQKRYNWS